MCGLIGGTGKIESRYLVALGCLAEDRGSDSAGVAWSVGDKLRVAKVARNPLVAYPVDLAPALRHAAKYQGPVIGHTRQATQGAVTARNAHPFIDEKAKIAWAHNGIITNDQQFGNFEVDSECLIGGIQKRDFSPYHGPIALLWIEGGKLHAFRKTNPLHRGVKKGAVYLASEARMLEDIGCHRIKELSEGFIYVWNGNQMESTTKVPYYSYAPAYSTDLTNWSDDEGYSPRCRRAAGFNPSHKGDGHYWMRDDVWHNHRVTVTWAYDCKGCNPAKKEDAEVTETGTTIIKPGPTTIIPVRKAGSLAESYVEKLEADDAARMVDAEALCHQCGEAPKRPGSLWCDDCFQVWRTH